jgi:MoCo/4Fe-4S cofactor protein with predicted Tat translocation signal
MIELPLITSDRKELEPDGARFWRSVSDLKSTDEFRKLAAEEMLPGANEGPSGATRRQFLQIMGASMALAGLSACRRPVENILPFARKPEDMIPGVPMNYATAMPFRGNLRPLLVESSDGRPTKIEGNPDHPHMQGSSTVFEQAALLGLYDPDRSQRILRDDVKISWVAIGEALNALGSGARVGIIAAPSSSMTMTALQRDIQNRYSELLWVDYSSTLKNASSEGLASVYGSTLSASHHFDRASVIVSLDADFLSPVNPDNVANTRDFSASRTVDDGSEMSRLYVVESQYSITGGMADNRKRTKSSDIPALTAALASAVGVDVSGGESFASDPFVAEMATDLRQAGSAGLVVAGEGQSADVHAIAAAINDSIGAVGNTVRYLETGSGVEDSNVDLATLAQQASAGNLDALFILNCNPVFDAPADLGLASALASMPMTMHLGMHVDETARACTYHVPAAHFLEVWSDGRSFDGTMSIVQPLIAPLYEDAKSDLELLALLAGSEDKSGYDLVRATWADLVNSDLEANDFEAGWRRVLHDGFLPETDYNESTAQFVSTGVPSSVATPGSGYEVVVQLDAKLLDGSFANNAWMQELPDPTSKVVWDNVAMMSPATAEEIGVGMELRSGANYSDRISLSVNGRSVDLPVWVQPGTADGSIGVVLGYGQEISSTREQRETHIFDLDHYTDIYGAGALANGVGVNVAPLRNASNSNVLTDVAVSKSGSDYMIATTQDHGALPEEGLEVEKRGIFRMATVEEYRANPAFITDGEPEPIREDWSDYPTLWENKHPKDSADLKSNDFYQYQWGMTIDLNTCTGCNACTVACQSENNIQVVGKEEVSRGREMHWIRLDRYFVSGDDGSFDDPRLVIQPMPCMMCENAPCEEVCPVAATVHSSDGMNQMIYNRCIGTRYCSNNCPYKVRRFNYYNWSKTLPVSTQMAHNPNVTVRSRGVMEKCSYCVQRIREVNKQVNVEQRTIQEGEVLTACQQACPAKAITFGNLNDSASAVSVSKQSDRRYEMLAELNIKPRTSYLGRIRNPNPRLESNA